MADLGLLAGLAEGLKSGFESYRDQSRYNEEQALKKRAAKLQGQQFQADLVSKGLIANEDGTVAKSPEQQEREQRDSLTKESSLREHGNEIVKDPETGKLIVQKIPGWKKPGEKDPILTAATALRGEYQGLPDVKKANTVLSSYKTLESVSKNPSAAGDLSLIFSYMRMLDPDSTVREGEQASARNAAGVPDQVRNMYNRIRTGEQLTAEQRSDFVSQARTIAQSATESIRGRQNEYRDLALRYGTDPGLIYKSVQDLPKTQPLTRPNGLLGKTNGLLGGAKEAQATQKPDFLKMTDEELRAYVGVKP